MFLITTHCVTTHASYFLDNCTRYLNKINRIFDLSKADRGYKCVSISLPILIIDTQTLKDLRCTLSCIEINANTPTAYICFGNIK